MRGRAQPVTEPVLTPSGWRPIGDLVPGDEVIGSDGRPTEVLGTFPQGEKDIFRSPRRTARRRGAPLITCGRSPPRRRPPTREAARCSRPARWSGDSGPRTTTATSCRCLERTGRVRRARGPDGPIRARLLLGDGCLTGSTTPSFATKSELVVASAATRRRDPCDGRPRLRPQPARAGGGVIVENPVTGCCDGSACGDVRRRSSCQSIPRHAAARLGVQGLLDSDGGPVKQRGRTCGSSTDDSPQLRDDVRFLVRSLGGIAYATVAGPIGRVRASDMPSCRPAGRAVPARPQAPGLPRSTVVADPRGSSPRIEPDGVEEAVCIRVAAADSLYVTEDLLVTHNTLNDAFIVLDEAQNTTAEQMKMFLTRIGFNSKAVVTGDVSQVDLPSGKRSGLRVVRRHPRGHRGRRVRRAPAPATSSATTSSSASSRPTSRTRSPRTRPRRPVSRRPATPARDGDR